MATLKVYEKEINTSKTWYFYLSAYLVGVGVTIKDALGIFAPDKPSDIFGFFTKNALPVLQMLSIVTAVFAWLRFFKHIYNHWGKEKDKDYWLNFAITLGKNLAITAVLILGAVGAFYIAPYVLAAVMGINALYCFGKVLQHVYEGFFNSENDAATKSEHRWACVRQILGLVINTLVFVFTLNLGIFFSDAATKLSTGDFSALTEMVDLYTSMQAVVWAFIGTVATALTLGYFKGPNAMATAVASEKEIVTAQVSSTPEMGYKGKKVWTQKHYAPANPGNNSAALYNASNGSDVGDNRTAPAAADSNQVLFMC